MLDLLLGAAMLIVWAVLQFAVQPATGMIHVLLAGGVVMLVRWVVRSGWGTPAPR